VVHEKHSVEAEQINRQYANSLIEANQDRTLAYTSVRAAQQQSNTQGSFYQATPELKSQVLAIVTAKLTDERQALIKRWCEQYVPMLESGQRKALKSQKRFKDDLKRGVPPEIRGEIWQHMVGNKLRITPALYEALLKRVRVADQA
jgi:hypothetical protein